MMNNLMMVHKYPLNCAQEGYVITMPFRAEILSFQLQRGIPCIWAKVDADSDYDPVERYFFLLGTGHQFPKINDIDTSGYLEFIGTIQFESGSLVFHLFELPDGAIEDMKRIDDQVSVETAFASMARASVFWPDV